MTSTDAVLVTFSDSADAASSLLEDCPGPMPLVWAASRGGYARVVMLCRSDWDSTRTTLLEKALGSGCRLEVHHADADAIHDDPARLLLHLAETWAHASPDKVGEMHLWPGPGFTHWHRVPQASSPSIPVRWLHAVAPRFPGDPAATYKVQPSPTSDPPPVVKEARSAYRPTIPAKARDAARSLTEEATRRGLVGSHPLFLASLERAVAVRDHAVPVLLIGDSGTGKGVLARFLHETGPRRRGPFVSVNSAALPDQLVESTLFGHCRGAFTGATEDRLGKFEAADQGTLFLDELGELPVALQPKLLKVLEDGEVERVGEHRGRPVDVRVIAATNRDLAEEVRCGRFREDLYYRINFASICLPALRDRREDIPALALHLLDEFNQQMQRPSRLTPAALQYLAEQSWSGNVRQLQNVLGRSILFAGGELLDIEDLVLDQDAAPSTSRPRLAEGFSLETYLADTRRQLVEEALGRAEGNQAAAARLLGVSPQAVNKFIKQAKPRARDE